MCSMIGASAAETAHCASKSDVSSLLILPPVVNPEWPCFADLAALAHGVMVSVIYQAQQQRH